MELEGNKSEGYIADDETRPGLTVTQRLKERVAEYENHLNSKESSEREDPHITPMPQQEKPGFFSKLPGHQFGGQEIEKEAPTKFENGAQPAPEVQAANKGVGSSELGTGYEEDGEETTYPAKLTSKYDGVKLPSEMQGGYTSFGCSEQGSEGSLSHTKDISDL